MFALPCFDIGNERWTTSGFLTRLSNGGPPQVPGTHAGTRGAGEFDGIIAAVKEDEIYYHRDQCDMITMILRLAAEPAWRYERGRQTTPAADRNRRIGGCGTRVIDQACPWERVLYCYFSAPGVLCHSEKAHPSAHGVPYYKAIQTNDTHIRHQQQAAAPLFLQTAHFVSWPLLPVQLYLSCPLVAGAIQSK